jgi:hypothetical protein
MKTYLVTAHLRSSEDDQYTRAMISQPGMRTIREAFVADDESLGQVALAQCRELCSMLTDNPDLSSGLMLELHIVEHASMALWARYLSYEDDLVILHEPEPLLPKFCALEEKRQIARSAPKAVPSCQGKPRI